MSKYHVYGLGAALVDTEVEVTDDFLSHADIEKGLMTLVDENRQQELTDQLQSHLVGAKKASGGSAANTIIANSYFGGSSFYSCKVADDDNGQFYLDDLSAAGVDFKINKNPEGTTGKCLVMITDDAERTMNTYLGISETLSVEDLNADAIKKSEYVYIEGYLVTSATGKVAAKTCREIAQQNNIKVSLSLSDPGIVNFFKDGLAEIIGDKIDLVFCNEDEAKTWADSDNIDDAIAAMKAISHTFAITRGAKGAVVFDGTVLSEVAAFPVKPIDTNGAGDMFAGAFLYAITHGYSFADAGRLANMAASQIVTHYGPRLPKEHYQAILQRLHL